MPDYSTVGKGLFFLGLFICCVGGVVWYAGKWPSLGQLPGDVKIESSHVSFYFPLASCLLFSLFVSIFLWIVSKVK